MRSHIRLSKKQVHLPLATKAWIPPAQGSFAVTPTHGEHSIHPDAPWNVGARRADANMPALMESDFCTSAQMESQVVYSLKDFRQTPAQIHAPCSAFTKSCLWLPRQPREWPSGGLVYPSENGLGVEIRTGPGNGLGPFGRGTEGSGVPRPGLQGYSESSGQTHPLGPADHSPCGEGCGWRTAKAASSETWDGK